jgi:hypothetical protein
MNTPTFTIRFLEPLLTIEQVSQETETPATTIRTWVQRGLVDLVSSINPGRGARALYSMRDVLQFLVFSELSKISRGPALLDQRQADYVFGIVQGQAEALDQGKILDDSDHFVFICWADDKLICDSSTKPDLEFEREKRFREMNNSWIVLDCHRLAQSLLDIFGKYSE